MVTSSLELSHDNMSQHKCQQALLSSCAVRTSTEKVSWDTFSRTCRCLYWGFSEMNFRVSCFWRATMGSAFPTRHSSGDLDRWRKYLSNWKYKEILKEVGWAVQLQGFAGSVEASGVSVLRNWAFRGLYWALDPVDRYIAAFVTAWLWWKWQVQYW